MTQIIGVSRALLEEALEVLPDAAISCDSEGRVLSGNLEARKLCQVGKEGFSGQPLSRFLSTLGEWEGHGGFIDMVRLGVLDSEQHLNGLGGKRRLVWCRSRLVANDDRTSHFVLLTMRDVTTRSLNEKRLREMAITDGLTGLHNRRYLDSILDFEVERARRFGFHLACAFIDLDRFKRINDEYGHYVGDEALKAVAHVLQQECRKIDTVCRWGGDEFVVVMLVREAADVKTFVERLVTAASGAPIEAGGQTLFVTLSCGVAMCAKDAEVNPRELLERADALLRRAKSGGRNRVFVENPSEAAAAR